MSATTRSTLRRPSHERASLSQRLRTVGHVVTSRSPLAWLFIGFVILWRRFISPLYGDVCKFHPTCSSYGLTALQTHGAIRGSWLIVRRLVRCHPWSLGGYDPVPGAAAQHPDPSQGDHP